MANFAVKSSTIVQEMAITLSLRPSFVVTRTTGPGSISVNALPIGRFSIPTSLLHAAHSSRYRCARRGRRVSLGHRRSAVRRLGRPAYAGQFLAERPQPLRRLGVDGMGVHAAHAQGIAQTAVTMTSLPGATWPRL